ncbi:protein of unknown function [Geodermatophilus telluris]|uniref:DUF4397 domain-containing protein n=1 Tax=Geodermatophilus telluris TaxID=1190417 RepID=A0A1G6I486_9ACTN|nr:DUF4397 domain-containing protein [Geodermatophilus telluris]SDC01261.1 protein of unknown function [Geodermatophilus telluris]
MTATRLAAAGRLLAVTALTAAALACPAPAARAAEGGLLRLAHLSPDTPAVDVYVDPVAAPGDERVVPAVAYGTVSDYQDVPPGSYAVSVRPVGADPATPPVLSATVQVDADSARTVAGVGTFADLGLEVLDDDLTPPAAGSARLRVVAAAAGAPTLDVAVPGGPVLATGLAFTDTSAYLDVPAGATALTVTPAGGPATELPVELTAGSIHSVLVLDRPGGGLAVRTVLDAAGPGVVPAGGVEAGAGGTADDGLPLPAVAGAVLVWAATRTGAGRRRHGARPGPR